MRSKWAIAATIIIAIAVIVAVAVMMNRDSRPTQYSVADGHLTITCSFGVSVPLEEISGLMTTKAAPEICTKTNGAGIGGVYKGEFLLSDGSAARLYIDESVPLYIRFTRGDIIFYINAETAEATQTLYDELLAALD